MLKISQPRKPAGKALLPVQHAKGEDWVWAGQGGAKAGGKGQLALPGAPATLE